MAYRLRMTSPHGPRGMKRQYRIARNEALKSSGAHWRIEILPKHFATSATARYRYEKRTPDYERRKRREGRGTQPNVYTGRLRNKMMSTKPSITTNKSGMTMVWRGLPRYTYIVDTVETIKRGKRKGQAIVVKRPNKPEELVAMNRQDADEVAKVYAKGFGRRVQRLGGAK